MKMDDLRIRKTKDRKCKMIEWIQAKKKQKNKKQKTKTTKKRCFQQKKHSSIYEMFYMNLKVTIKT